MFRKGSSDTISLTVQQKGLALKKQFLLCAIFAVIGCAQQKNTQQQPVLKSMGFCDLKQLELQAKAEDAGAQNGLGWFYLKTKNFKKAVYWFRKSAARGRAGGEFNLGVCYEMGYGVLKDEKKAAYWYAKAVEHYRQSAEQGDALNQWNLGHSYFEGKGVSKNEAQAVVWIKKAAAQGLDHAKQWLKEHVH
jgi:hypothetical protein